MLISRLLQAKTFKDASRVLEQRIEEGAGFHPRQAGIEEPFLHLCPDLLVTVSPDDLRRVAEMALSGRPVPVVDLSHVSIVRANVRDAMAAVVRRLPGAGRRTLRQITAGAQSRLEVVVTLLALLELYKQGLVELHQAQTFGELSAEWTGDDERPAALTDWSAAAEWDDDAGDDEGADERGILDS